MGGVFISVKIILHLILSTEVNLNVNVVGFACGYVVDSVGTCVFRDILSTSSTLILMINYSLQEIGIAIIKAHVDINAVVAVVRIVIEVIGKRAAIITDEAEVLKIGRLMPINIHIAQRRGLLHAVYIHLYGDVGAVIGDVTDGYGRAFIEQDAAVAVPQARLFLGCGSSVGGIYAAGERLADARRFIHLDGEGYDELVAMPAAVFVDNNIRCIRVVKVSDADFIAVHGDGNISSRHCTTVIPRQTIISAISCRDNVCRHTAGHIAIQSYRYTVAKVKILRQRIRECGRCANSSAGDFAADGLKDTIKLFRTAGSKIVTSA